VSRAGSVALVVDDDPQVCQALRESGYPVEQATWMPPPPALTQAQEREGRT
jgi:hypothetical protein